MYRYSYKGFAVFINPSAYAKYGDSNWKPDKATPIEWGYRIDQIPGRLGISKNDGYSTKELAEVAAEERIDSWN